jgi:hypothetical protein
MLLIKNLVIDGQDSAIDHHASVGSPCRSPSPYRRRRSCLPLSALSSFHIEDARNNMVLSRSLFNILSRWGCDHPLNSVPGNGTGFPYTEKPRNQTLSSDCGAKVRRIFGSCLVVGW